MAVLSYPFAWLPVAIVLGVSATLAAPLLAFVGLIVFLVVALVAVVASARRLVATLRPVGRRLSRRWFHAAERQGARSSVPLRRISGPHSARFRLRLKALSQNSVRRETRR